ncbi:MAG: hypothetical protein AB7O92_00010 [Acidimicrobiia bacterium]
MRTALRLPRPPGDDTPVALADFVSRAAAERLAVRLRAEGVGARVWEADEAAVHLPVDAPPIGPTVMVRAADREDALTLAVLFAEIDEGVSQLAPPPVDFWHGSGRRQLLGAVLLLGLAMAVSLLLLIVAQY